MEEVVDLAVVKNRDAERIAFGHVRVLHVLGVRIFAFRFQGPHHLKAPGAVFFCLPQGIFLGGEEGLAIETFLLE